MELRVEPCDDAAFRMIAPRLRVEDQTEWRLSAGDTPAGLCASGSYKLPAGAGTINRIAYDPQGLPLCVWGVCPHFPPESYYHKRVGWVWLVATPEAVPAARSLHRLHLDSELGAMLAIYPRLVTASYIRNTLHHTWLKWLGFVASERKVVTPLGGVFIPFSYKPESAPCA